jgi:hypothetical protein
MVGPMTSGDGPRSRSRRLEWIVLAVCGCALLASFVVGAEVFGERAPQLRVFVTLRRDGVQVTNETDVGWDRCVVTVLGGFVAPETRLLYPHGTIRHAYDEFRRDGIVMAESEAVSRAKQRTEIACSGMNGARQHAVLTFP